MTATSTFFCGIGGSGMLHLACIVRASGSKVAGSDRALDAGRLAPKFEFLRRQGISLFPQDGSGLQPGMTLVTSAAVEDTIPDVVRSRELGLTHLTRPQLLSQLLNAAGQSVAVGGTSGKSTVTGIIGWILNATGRRPTVMNGAVMKNFVTDDTPFASAFVGDPDLFVSEVDESDGSIALYRPTIALLNNVSLDHKEMDELRSLFGAFLRAADKAVVNLDDAETRRIAGDLTEPLGYGFDCADASIRGRDLQLGSDGSTFTVAANGEQVIFQPHGYGPLAKMGEELSRTFAGGLRAQDVLLLSNPVYQGGTVDRSRGSDWLADAVRRAGGTAEHLPERSAIGARLLAEARPGDRVAILGARDDTLSEFAAELLRNLAARG
jgi:UDP-N-acetylmuramate--alanine ligase